jgi:hypothetical protein
VTVDRSFLLNTFRIIRIGKCRGDACYWLSAIFVFSTVDAWHPASMARLEHCAVALYA